MRHFLIITNTFKDEDLKLTKEMIAYIEEKGGTAKALLSNSQKESNQDVPIEEIPKNTECIFVLGGDGTLIRAATKVKELGVPLIGVNLGTLGYLCELEENTVFPAIDCLMKDDYLAEERMMLTGFQEKKAKARAALNDIVIHRTKELSILSLHVYVNGEFLSTYHADGIIVATPTGSTGYNMSAGGPIVDPKANMILLTPINAHNLNSKSIVLAPDSEIEIEIATRRAEKDEHATVSFDGDAITELGVGDRFVIARANSTTKICKLSKKSFLEILRKKMESYT